MFNAIRQCLGLDRKSAPQPVISKPTLLRPFSLQPSPRHAPKPPERAERFKLAAMPSLKDLHDAFTHALESRAQGTTSPLQPPRPIADVPQDVTPRATTPRPPSERSYKGKGKERAGPPPVKPLDLPTAEQVADDESISSGSSHYSTLYG